MVLIERDVEKSCFTPRDYQVELLDKACKRNVIVQLGTGAGKTFIAVLLLKEYGLQLQTPFESGGKRAFFIVDKVSLVDQQADHIECHTTFSVGKMHGNLNNDIWGNKAAFEQFMDTNNVVVVTAQVLLDLVDHAFFDLSQAAVLVFDECHHALGIKHPYRVIMDRYIRLSEDVRPRVLGLTASLINDKTPPNQLEAKLSKLESVLHCSIETASDLLTISKFGAKPFENIVVCRNYNSDNGTNRDVLFILDSLKNFCTQTNEFDVNFDMDPRRPILEALNKTAAVLRQIGPWAAWKVSQVWEKEFKKLAKQSFLPEKAIDFMIMGETCMNTIRCKLEPKMRLIRSFGELTQFLPHKVARLLDILAVYSPENQNRLHVDEPLCAIIFVEQRYVAYVMSLLLKTVHKWDSRFEFLKPDFVIGFSGGSLASDESQGIHKRQEEVLRKFRRGELNVLVATNVLEEGVDVRHCNVVFKFDRPLDYRAYVQSKGRARKEGAHYFMMVEEMDYSRCSDDIRDFVQIEKLLLRRYRTVHNPGELEFSPAENIDLLYPPYRVPATGAQVTLSTAIALVNRYCGKLPSDIFTRLFPESRIIPVDCGGVTMYKAELLLPINSPLKKPIRLTTPMESKKLAQMCVALEACRLLHEKGELNDHLLPVGRESIANLLCHLDDEPDEWAPGINAKVGSARRKQLYDKRVARALHEALPAVGQPCYVYVMELELMKEPSLEHNPKRRKFTNPEEYQSCFGFLSSRKLPKIPSFPAYLRQGDMRVHLVCSPSTLTLDSDTLNRVKHFHHYIFKNVLQLFKSNLDFRLDEITPINTLIVPLNRITVTGGKSDYSLNMKYVSDVFVSMGDIPRIPDPEERKNYKFRAEDYKDSVVMPWYRNLEQPVFYYVAQILDTMSPESPFPDAEYQSFNEYFIKKYNLEIYDQDQSLLDVDFSSNRLNLLLPRSGGARRKLRTEAPTSQQQIFVPELMDRHPISATLWNLIAALPSFFYRINHLLLADELRATILTTALDNPQEASCPPDDFHWNPLSYPATYEEKQSIIVSKIQQLRELNKLNKSTEAVDDSQDTVKKSSTADVFEIGVWDPELGSAMMPPIVPTEKSSGERDRGAGDTDETVGLISSAVRAGPGDMSDDEEDAEAVVMFDFAKYLADKSGGTSSDFAAPRDDIEEYGWGELVETVPDTPFQLINVGGAVPIDVGSLMADLQQQIMPDVEAAGRMPVTKANESTEIVTKPQHSESTKTNTKCQRQQTKTPQRLNMIGIKPELGLDFEDRDRSQREDVIDLSLFDDEESESTDGQSSSQAAPSLSNSSIMDGAGSDDEFNELEVGERIKKERDTLLAAKAIIPKGEVLAPSHDARFSFASASPSVSSLTSCPSTSGGNDLMHENPFGVSPCLLLTALTTSNANDGINLERLETIGDSFLKYAVTDYLYHQHFDQHEGKLSFARSKEVSNCNLYRLGKRLGIPSLIVGSKFDVQDSWLPPCYVPTVDFKAPNTEDAEERDRFINDVLDGKGTEQVVKARTGWDQVDDNNEVHNLTDGVETINFPKPSVSSAALDELSPLPYNMLTQQYISDKSIADAVEALIGAHLLTLGPHPTLKVMKWLGLKVLTATEVKSEPPLLRFVDTEEDPRLSYRQLTEMYSQFKFSRLEETIGYRFNDKAYLIQAFTHASYYKNRITGCYQRLEFLGDAVLDYMITRFLFEDGRQYSPGVLTDLRSALVNNTIFASLAIKYNFHKHFVAMCPRLHHMIEKFVRLCAERKFFDANFNAEMYMVTTEEEIDEGQEEDIEVPKAMSDIFESVAGAIYLDSGRDLDVVWRVFHHLMKQTIEECCANPPRSPIRELMELEPGKTRFAKMERIIESGKVRVTVEVSSKMRFTGMGRNYRIAKTTAAKRALRYLKSLEEQKLKEADRKAKEVSV